MKERDKIKLQKQIDAQAAMRGASESRRDTKESAEIAAMQIERQTTAERQQKFRNNRRAYGLVEIRGIFTKAENHRAIKCFAEALDIGFIKAKKGAKK